MADLRKRALRNQYLVGGWVEVIHQVRVVGRRLKIIPAQPIFQGQFRIDLERVLDIEAQFGGALPLVDERIDAGTLIRDAQQKIGVRVTCDRTVERKGAVVGERG